MPGQLRRSLGNLGRLDRSQLTPVEALRVTVGVVLPLVVAVAAGRPGDGVAVAAGALSVGFASFQGVYRTRVRAMVLTACGMSVSTLVGGLVGGQPALLVLLTAVWALGAGLLDGPRAGRHDRRAAVHGRADHRGRLLDDPGAGARAGRAGPGRRPAADRARGRPRPLRTRGQERVRWPRRTPRWGAMPATAPRRAPCPTPGRSRRRPSALNDANPLAQDHVLRRFRALLDVAERARVDIAALSRARAQLDLDGPGRRRRGRRPADGARPGRP